MRYLRDIAALIAAFLGGWMWAMYIWNHCCDGKGDPTDTPPSAPGLIVLIGFVLVISLMFTRSWLLPAIIGLMPVLFIDTQYIRDLMDFGLPQSFVWLAMILPVLLIVGSAFLGAKLRTRMWPIGTAEKTKATAINM